MVSKWWSQRSCETCLVWYACSPDPREPLHHTCESPLCRSLAWKSLHVCYGKMLHTPPPLSSSSFSAYFLPGIVLPAMIHLILSVILLDRHCFYFQCSIEIIKMQRGLATWLRSPGIVSGSTRIWNQLPGSRVYTSQSAVLHCLSTKQYIEFHIQYMGVVQHQGNSCWGKERKTKRDG